MALGSELTAVPVQDFPAGGTRGVSGSLLTAVVLYCAQLTAQNISTAYCCCANAMLKETVELTGTEGRVKKRTMCVKGMSEEALRSEHRPVFLERGVCTVHFLCPFV